MVYLKIGMSRKKKERLRCSCKRAFAVCDLDYAMRNPGIAGFRQYFSRDEGTSH